MSNKIIKIFIRGGCCVDVQGLPKGYHYKIIDHDNGDTEDNTVIVQNKVKP
jgi:hypothetical protein